MRCIKCGSGNVSLVTRNEGYSFKKGIAGQLILGPAGAVAGINGKQSKVYHCNACGADEITAMPDVIENFINEAIRDNNTSRLEQYKNQYCNIEWNGIDNSDVSNVTTVINNNYIGKTNDDTRIDPLPESDIKVKIKQFLGQSNIPLTIEDIAGRLNISSNTKEYRNIIKQIQKCMDTMVYDGIIHWEKIGNELYARLPKDMEEMIIWKKDSEALKSDYKPYLDEVRQFIVGKGVQLSEKDITAFLKEKHLELANENEYLPSAISRNCIQELIEENLISQHEDFIRIMTDEELLEVSFQSNYENGFNKFLNSILLSYHISIRIIYNCLIDNPGQSFKDIIDSVRLIDSDVNIYPASINKAVERGLFLLEEKDDIKRYYPNDLKKYFTASLVEPYLYREIINKLKNIAEGMKISDLIDCYSSQFSKEDIYLQIKCAQLFHDVILDKEANACLFVDCFEREKQLLVREKQDLIGPLEIAEEKLNAFNQTREKREHDVKNKQFDDANYTSSITDFQNKIKEANYKLSNLGLFKRKEKEFLNRQIDSLKRELADLEIKRNEAKENFEKNIRVQLADIDLEGANIKTEIESTKKSIEDIEKREIQYNNGSVRIEQINALVKESEELNAFTPIEKRIIDIIEKNGGRINYKKVDDIITANNFDRGQFYIALCDMISRKQIGGIEDNYSRYYEIYNEDNKEQYSKVLHDYKIRYARYMVVIGRLKEANYKQMEKEPEMAGRNDRIITAVLRDMSDEGIIERRWDEAEKALYWRLKRTFLS